VIRRRGRARGMAPKRADQP